MKNMICSILCFLFLFNPFLEGATWTPTTTIGSNVSSSADVAVDKSGNAISLFVHFDGTHQRIQSALKPLKKTWKTLEQFLSPSGFNAENPKIAASRKGHATAVWKVQNDTGFIVQAATLDFKCEIWSSPINLTGNVELIANPIVAIDSKGNSIAVWSIFDGTADRIQSAILKYGSSAWINLSDIVETAFNLDLAFDPTGNAVLIWEGRTGFKNIIQAATLKFASNAWVQTADISPSNVSSNDPKVDVDGAGNAVAVWSEGIISSHIAGARLEFGSTAWIHTSNLSPANESIFPEIAVDLAGNAVAVWKTLVGSTYSLVEASTLPVGSLTWKFPTTLANSLVITDPQVAVDRHGNALSVWSASGVLQFATLPFGKNWSDSADITPATIGVGGVRLAMTPCAFAVSTYTAQVFSTSEEVVQAVNSLGLFPPSPPRQLKGRAIINQFLLQREFVHRLTWHASRDSCVKEYFVRRNGKLIGKVSKKEPLIFDDHDRPKKKKDTYAVTSVKPDGTESAAVTITLH